MHLFGLASWRQEKSVLKNAKNNATIPGRISETNQQSILLQQMDGGTSGIQNVQKSPAKILRTEVGYESFCSFASSLRGIDIFNSLASLHGNEQHQWTEQYKTTSRIGIQLSSRQKCCQSQYPSFKFDLEILELNFTSERARNFTEKSSFTQIHTVAAKSCR